MIADDRRRRRRRLAVELILLAIVLGGHAWTRVQSAQEIGYDQRNFYSRDYHVSLAILLGRGFDLLRLDTPEGAPLYEFTMLKRERLDRADLEAFDAADRVRPPSKVDSEIARRRNEFSRVFDFYVAAALWSVFGIHWGVHTAFYIGVSVLCGLLVFLMARRISGSFGCGLIAAALFAFSPLETEYAIASVRDTNPLWFTIIAYCVVTCVADRFKSIWANGLSYFATGAASAIGLGWRPDSSMLIPVTLATMVAVMIWNRRRWPWLLGGILLFLAGAKTPMLVIDQLLPDDAPPRGAFQFLHVSHYADATRSNLFEEENSFQTLRDDSFIWSLAKEYHEHDPIESREEWDETLWGPAYSNLMVRIFRDMAQYHLFDWAKAFPSVYLAALIDASDPDGVHPLRFGWWLPWAALVGGLGGLLVYRERAPVVLSLFVFTVFYGCVFLAVLPEEKHLAPFVCPLSVLGALGLWIPVRLFFGRGSAPAFEMPFRLRPRWIVGAAVLAVVGLVATLVAARGIASAKRQEYLAAVRACESAAVDAGAAIADPRVFATTVDVTADAHEGYVLEIVARERPGALVLRVIPEAGGRAPAFENHHALVPGTRQRFFWSCYRGWRHYDGERSLYSVRLTGDAEIVAAYRLDLGDWKRLPFATVFTDDDTHAGSPSIGHPPAVAFLDRAVERNAWGLTGSETLVTGLGPRSSLVVERVDVTPVGDSMTRTAQDDETWITTSAEPNVYTAQFSPFTAPQAGRYLFRLKTRTERGGYAFGLLSGDQTRWMPLAGTADDIVSGGEASLLLCDLTLGEAVVPTLSNTALGGEASYRVLGLEIRRLEE